MTILKTAALFLALSVLLPQCAEARTVDEHIYIVPVGDVDRKIVEKIRQAIPDRLPMTASVEVWPQETILQDAYDAARKQYDAQALLSDIAQRQNLDTRNESVLAIVDVDLYMPDMNFVFGLADAKKSVCIMSLVRLRNEFYALKPNDGLFADRAAKEALHELGHVWGLGHCSNPKCVMYFSNKLPDTDKKRDTFCHDCTRTLGHRYLTPLVKGFSL
jgi:archaemetzincin